MKYDGAWLILSVSVNMQSLAMERVVVLAVIEFIIRS